MSDWQMMKSAPRDGRAVILMLADTIPQLPDVRLAQFTNGADCAELGEFDYEETGGWMIWNDGSDWFVVGPDDPRAWSQFDPLTEGATHGR